MFVYIIQIDFLSLQPYTVFIKKNLKKLFFFFFFSEVFQQLKNIREKKWFKLLIILK